MRYEDLISDPGNEFTNILEFMNIKNFQTELPEPIRILDQTWLRNLTFKDVGSTQSSVRHFVL